GQSPPVHATPSGLLLGHWVAKVAACEGASAEFRFPVPSVAPPEGQPQRVPEDNTRNARAPANINLIRRCSRFGPLTCKLFAYRRHPNEPACGARGRKRSGNLSRLINGSAW